MSAVPTAMKKRAIGTRKPAMDENALMAERIEILEEHVQLLQEKVRLKDEYIQLLEEHTALLEENIRLRTVGAEPEEEE